MLSVYLYFAIGGVVYIMCKWTAPILNTWLYSGTMTTWHWQHSIIDDWWM